MCAQVLTASGIELEPAIVAHLAKSLPPRIRPTLRNVAFHVGVLSESEVDQILVRLKVLASGPCMSTVASDTDSPDVYWREHSRIGVHAEEDRWPDEWGVEEWARYLDRPDEQAPAALALSVDTHARMASRFANAFWAWNAAPQASDDWDLARWSRDDVIRALELIRSAVGYSWEVRLVDLARIAVTARHPLDETILFVRYVDRCDRGLMVADPSTQSALDSFRQSTIKDLGVRVKMLDDYAVRDEPSGSNDPDGDDRLRDFEDPTFRNPVADDGRPDPLDTIKNLLPGGRWVLGKAPIVHSSTELETELLPRLFSGAPTLVILSGNAGDGKTAFIETVLERAGLMDKPVPNESVVSLDGRPYLIVLDGSEDTYSKSNAQLLEDALGQFRGDQEIDAERGTLIAVNKGRLLSFLESERNSYAALWALAQRRFADGEDTSHSKYLLVDLNDRTVVGPDPDESLFGQVLTKLLHWDGWAECAKCEAEPACPVVFNVTALRRQETMRRLWEVFALIDLDDRLHVTARHVVTRLASVISGGLRCPDIRSMVEEDQAFPERAYFYSGVFLGRADESSVEEAALNEIAAAYDPAETAEPARDRGLGFAIASGSLTEAALLDPLGPSSDIPALKREASSLASRTVDEGAAGNQLEYREAHLALMSRLLRRRYFLANENQSIVPVRSFRDYLDVVEHGDRTQLAARIVHSLNATLGIRRVVGGGLIVPRDYSRGLAGSGFALQVPPEQFEVLPGTGLGTTFRRSDFTRAWPRSLILAAQDEGQQFASLSIPLLMLEILDRADRGFRPTSRTERNYMIRVAAFYRRLAEHRWDRRLDYVLYERGRIRSVVALTADNANFWVP